MSPFPFCSFPNHKLQGLWPKHCLPQIQDVYPLSPSLPESSMCVHPARKRQNQELPAPCLYALAPSPGTGGLPSALASRPRHRGVSTGEDRPYRLGPLSQTFIFVVWVVGEGPSCAQLDSSQQLHASSEHGFPWCVRATRCQEYELTQH